MGICKKCGTEISDETEICDDCNKSNADSTIIDESYLDNLLNSMNNTQPSDRQDIPKKKIIEEAQKNPDMYEIEKKIKIQENDSSKNSAPEEQRMDKDDMKDIDDKSDILDDMEAEKKVGLELSEESNDFANFGQADAFLELEKSLGVLGLNESVATEKQLINENSDELVDIDLLEGQGKFEEFNGFEEFTGFDDIGNLDDFGDLNLDNLEDTEEYDNLFNSEEFKENGNEQMADGIEDKYDEQSANDYETDNISETEIDNKIQEQIDQATPDEFQEEYNQEIQDDLDLEDILAASHGMAQDEDIDSLVENILDNLDNTGNADPGQENSEAMDFEEANDSDLMELLGSMSLDDTNNNQEEELSKEENKDNEDQGTEFDDIFSLDDMFSSLNDENDSESISRDEKADNEDFYSGNFSSDSLGNTSEMDEDILNLIPEQKEEKAVKKSIWAKLFGNIKDEKSAKQHELDKNNNSVKKEKKKKSKDKNASPESTSNEDGQDSSNEEVDKKGKKGENNKKDNADKKEKKEKKAKEKKEKKVKEIMQEIEEEDQGRINKAGATIVFLVFTILATFIIIGTFVFSYSRSIKSAQNYFDIQKYSMAYKEVEGVTIKEKDTQLYDKIITVMIVNKQLDSFQNYYAIEMYPESLDSLLKGLKKYDEHIEDGRNLGIEKDMGRVKSQIITKLSDSFELSEEEAYELINIETQEEYGSRVAAAAYGD